jgi:hypothetical protein
MLHQQHHISGNQADNPQLTEETKGTEKSDGRSILILMINLICNGVSISVKQFLLTKLIYTNHD